MLTRIYYLLNINRIIAFQNGIDRMFACNIFYFPTGQVKL